MGKSARLSTMHPDERRLAGLAGILFSALSVAIIPFSPEIGAPIGSSADELVSYYVRHHSGFLLGNYLGVAAFLPGFIQLAIVSSWIRRLDEPHGWLGSLAHSRGSFAYSPGPCRLVVSQVLPFITACMVRLA